MDIRGQHSPQFGNAFQELNRDRLPLGLEVVLCRRALFAVLDARLVLQRAADLHGQLVVQAIDQVTRVIRDVAAVQTDAAPVPGIDHLLQIVQDLDHRFVLRQRTVPDVVDRPHFRIGC